MENKIPNNIKLSSPYIPRKTKNKNNYFTHNEEPLEELNLFYSLNKPVNTENFNALSKCKSCGAFENIYNENGKCIFCFLPNNFTNSIQSDVVKYKTDRTAEFTSLFLVDNTENNEAIMKAVRILLEKIPDDSNIIFLTFGSNINLHLKKSKYIFSGREDYLKKKFLFDDINFLIKKSEFKFSLENEFKKERGNRHRRCTGTALSFAITLLEDLKMASSIYLFTNGSCTFGPGAVANMALREPIRSSGDILNGASNNYASSAIKYFDGLTNFLISKNLSITVNLFSLILQDFGLYEMRNLIHKTGGSIVMAQDNDAEILYDSCRKFFYGEETLIDELENLNLNESKIKNNLKLTCKTKIITNKNIKFTEGSGPGYNINNIWLENGNIRNMLQFNFEAVGEGDGYIQIITEYTNMQRERNLKITTIKLPIEDLNTEKLNADALLCSIARQFFSVSHLLEEDLDLVRRVDRELLRMIRRVCSYKMLDINYVEIPEVFLQLAKYIYFFRRNDLFKTEICSPDEAIYYRHLMNSRSIDDVLLLICPTLIKIQPNDLPKIVPLDIQEMDDQSMFILNSFNDILFVRSRNERDVEIYDYINKIKRERFPEPKVTETVRGGSQERILLALLNPSVEGVINTEDITLERYVSELKKLVVEGAKR